MSTINIYKEKNMKVSLFDAGEGPYSFGTFGKSYWTSIPHYGLCALSASAKKAGHSVSLIDVRQLSGYPELERTIHEQDPDVVGLSMRTCDEIFLRDIAERIKRINPKIVVIAGGVHVGIAWDRLQKTKDYDYLVTGEGEGTFPRLLNYLEGKEDKKNLHFISEKVIRGESMEMDSVPFVDRELYSFRECIKHPNYPGILDAPMITMISSRGCPYGCKYCAPSDRSNDDALFGGKLKFASVDRVIDELKYLRDRYQFRSIKFYDYTFTINKKWVEEFCQKYRDNKFDQKFAIQTRADLIVKNPDIISLLSKVGLKIAIVGYESGSNKVLESLGKKTTAEQNLKAAEILKRNNIVNVANFMLGTPFETQNDVDLTVKHARKMKPDILSVSFYTPIEGTAFYDYVMDHDLSLIKSPSELYTYAPDFKRLKGVDYAYLKKASMKMLSCNFPIPFLGYPALLLYTKTKRHVAVREFLTRAYIYYVRSMKFLKGGHAHPVS